MDLFRRSGISDISYPKSGSLCGLALICSAQAAQWSEPNFRRATGKVLNKVAIRGVSAGSVQPGSQLWTPRVHSQAMSEEVLAMSMCEVRC